MIKENILPEDIEIKKEGLWPKSTLIGLIVGVIGLILTFSTYSDHHQHIFHSYLTALMFALSLALGALFFIIIQHLTRASWSISIRRIAENMTMTIPLIFLLLLPIAFFGMHDLYHWSHHGLNDVILEAKAPYLNVPFFFVRVAIYFTVWMIFAVMFRRLSIKQDSESNPAHSQKMRLWSAPAVPAVGVTLTFASFDLMMSLQPHWYSTIWGVYFFGGAMVGFYALIVLVSMNLQTSGYLKTAINTEHYHDMGKHVFGFTVFWAYIAFSQFFLIWYANIPEETEFYIHRTQHGWEPLSYLLPLMHFAIPFIFLLSRNVKRSRTLLKLAAVYMLIMHFYDMWWLIMPNMAGHGEHMGELFWVDIAAMVGVMGLFWAVFSFFMKKNKILAVGDPRIHEALNHENY